MDRWLQDVIENDPEVGISIKAAFIQMRNGRMCVLLGKHKKYNKYMLLGGRGEAKDLGGAILIEDILARELKEELGLRIWDIYPKSMELVEFTRPRDQLLTHAWVTNNKYRRDICLPFYISSDYQLPFDARHLPETSEIADLVWMPIDEFEDAELFDNTKAILRDLKKWRMFYES